MSDEASFLSAIRTAPTDAALRRVYADWLEERGDPRCELIRVEEEMRQLPVFADRYWQLKPRQKELRRAVASEWLEAMHYGSDCQPLFGHGVPDGCAERWRLIREFANRWRGLALGDVGGRVDEIRAIEFRLGRTLPAAVRAWVAFAHDVRQNAHYFDVLRDFFVMDDLADQPAVSLLLQCEGDYYWAVRHADWHLPDAPVHGFHWEDNEDEDGETLVPDQANPLASTVTAFALYYVMSNTTGQGGGFTTEVARPAKLLANLEKTFPVHCRFEHTDIFETENILVWLTATGSKSAMRLRFLLAKPMADEALPKVLRDCMRRGGAFLGTFGPTLPF
jgi:uncharacterized protein (TIGR02996 family)